jgi:hypothetical protein
MPEKHEVVERLKEQLALGEAFRVSARADSDMGDRRQKIRLWQSERLARTHGDFLTISRYRAAAVFFLTDLYGPVDLSKRYTEIERVLPIMVKMLPASSLDVIADAVELDALCESLDTDILAALGPRIATLDDAAYGDAYRKMDRRPDRIRQINLIRDLGMTLDHVAKIPMVHGTIKKMHLPAKIIGLGELQNFLERGFDAFSAMKGADGFVSMIVKREVMLSEALFAGDDRFLGKPAIAWGAGLTVA